MEDGHLTDSFGRRVDFRNAVLIMTSNVGADLVRKQGNLGFTTKPDALNYENMRTKLLDEVKRVFRPEFLNRVDDLIVFHPLLKDDLCKIIDIELSHLHKRLEKLGYELEVTDTAKDYIIEKGWDAQFGARPLKRAIQKYIEDVLAEEIIKNVLQAGDRIYVDHEEGKDDMTIDIRKGTPLPANATEPKDN